MDGPGSRDYYTKWSKSERERKVSYDIVYMYNIKKRCKWTYLHNRNRLTDIDNKPMTTKEERLGEINQELEISRYKQLYIE